MNDSTVSCFSIILVVLIFIGAMVFNCYKCHSKAEMQGYECSWGPIQGCMVKQKDGTWIDYDRLRIMEKIMTSLRDKFEIVKKDSNKKSEPRYVLNISMDSNDGDYIRDTVSFSKSNWESLPEFFFLMLSYAAQGYSGKFSHGESWGNYYGHHWEENKHGLSEELRTWADDYSIMQHSDWGSCHSFSQLYLYYYDEDNKQFEVKIPSIDNEFNTEEEMIKAIKDAYDSYNKKMR